MSLRGVDNLLHLTLWRGFGFVTALSQIDLRRGPLPVRHCASFNPVRLLLTFAGECPLYVRATVILILVTLYLAGTLLNVVAPVSANFLVATHSRSVYEAAHANVHHHAQRQKHEQHRRPAVTH